MTQFHPASTGRLATSQLSVCGRPAPPLIGNRNALLDALAAKRAQMAALETAWVAASEADATRGGSPTVRVDDRATWDKPTWNRYLAAAASHEPDYKPRIKRLLCEIDSIEVLLMMPNVPAANAA